MIEIDVTSGPECKGIIIIIYNNEFNHALSH